MTEVYLRLMTWCTRQTKTNRDNLSSPFQTANAQFSSKKRINKVCVAYVGKQSNV